MVEHLTVAEFKEKVSDFDSEKDWKFKGDIPCVIDFYADWCTPCQMVAPVLDQLSRDYAGKVNVFKVNTDQEQELARAFGIQSIPSILFIPMKGDPRMSVGAMSKKGFEKVFDDLISSKDVEADITSSGSTVDCCG